MLKLERILCPIDFSEASAKAYDYAYSIALHYNATLYLQHTVELLARAYPYFTFPDTLYEDMTRSAEQRLGDMISDSSRKGVQTKMAVQTGFPADAILAFAKDRDMDMIVMSTHGRRALDRLIMGSVTEHVLRRASCPVLAVRRPAHDFVNTSKSQDPISLKKLLVCTDFSKPSETALQYALSLAQEYNAELSMLHVLEDVPESKANLAVEEVRRKLESLIPDDARNWCTIKPVIRMHGKAYQEIIQFAVEQQTDLAVLGVRGRSAVDMAIFGSTTNRVLQLGPCPVLVVQ